MAPDEDPREASSIYPKIPLQLSNIASWMSYNINSTLLWETADALYANDIVAPTVSTGVPYIPGQVVAAGDGNQVIRPGATDMGVQRAPTLDDIENAIRKCRSGIIGSIRPDIDDVYCIMSEDMFRALVRDNQTAFRNASFTGRESTLWTVNQVAQVFGIGLILRNAVLRYDPPNASDPDGFIHPLDDSFGGAIPTAGDRDTALFFRRGSLLQYTSRPYNFRDVNTPEFLGSTYRWKVNYGAGANTKYPLPTTANTRGVVALYAASGA